MRITDSKSNWGLVTWSLHWVMFIAMAVVFGLGLWMTGLNYYSPWYTKGPDIHRSVGMLLLFALIFRFGWRVLNPKPSEAELSPAERLGSHLVHWGFYPLMFALFISGYLISTAAGKPVSVFGWFNVPAILTGPGQETTSGYIHMILAWTTLALVVVHALAAIKHHLWDKSHILSRMLAGPFSTTSE